MNIQFRQVKVPLREIIPPLFIVLLVVIGTFPENDWSFTIGIDSPLKWVFNQLFESGLTTGKNIIFPHGPLAFLMYPLSENILLATLIHAILKAIIVFGAAGLLYKRTHRLKWIAVSVFAYGISIVAGFNHLLLGSIILLYLNYYQHRLPVLKFTAFFLTALAFYVKAYVAILSGTVFISFLLYEAVKYRRLKTSFITALSMLGLMLLFQVAMYGTPAGFFHYLWGMLHLAQDNSAAAALYPHNNWLFLALALLAVVLMMVLNRTPKSAFFTTLFTLSIFAAWKHGMAREDFYHVKGMLIYLLILFSSFLLFEQKKWPLTASLAMAALVLLGLNIRNSKNYQSFDYRLWQGQHFWEFVTHFNELKTQAHQKTADNLVSNRLSQAMRDSISDATCDVYPWDYSVAAINNLNWQPRPVIQSYAVYTSWLDQQNAAHWASDSAPEFIVWDQQKITVDVNKSKFSSIDSRYLLNDEPQSLLQMLSRYRVCCADDKFLLLKKRKSAVSLQKRELHETKTTWNTWVEAPRDSTGLIRCKLHFDKSLLQQLKSFFYKDEQVWIYLKLSNGVIHKYRIVPKNAADGLWINPYLFDLHHRFEVEQILFKASNKEILKPQLEIKWELIRLNDSDRFFTDYFHIDNTPDSLVYTSTNTFESAETKHWKPLKAENRSSDAYKATSAFKLAGTQFSSSFSYHLDSINPGQLKITADAWIKVPAFKPNSAISLVMELKNESGRYLYHATRIPRQVIEEKGWNHIFGVAEPEQLKPNSELAVYFWSPENERMYIDDFRVRLLSVSGQ